MTKENALRAYEHYKEVVNDKEKHPMPDKLRQNAVRALADMKEKLKRSYGVDVDAPKAKSKETK